MDGNKGKATLVVVGGGAAGFFCAINAAAAHKRLQVIILEKSGKLLSKVKISGGGRCNVTNACDSISEMARKYPRGERFVKKAFHQFFTGDTVKWFADRGVKLKAEPDGRMFPVTDSSQTIVNCLLQAAGKAGIDIRMHAEVTGCKKEDSRFEVQLADGKKITADFVCIACGGYPKSSMFDWLRSSGHRIAEPVPSLFTFNLPGHPVTELTGISVEKAGVRIPGLPFKEKAPLLITHWGLSGPAILRLSAWGARELAAQNWHFPVQVNWLPEYNEERLQAYIRQLRVSSGAQKIHARNNPFGLPARLWNFLAHTSGITAETRWAELPAKAQNKLIKNLCAYDLAVSGKTTYKEEFVTAGGICLDEIEVQSMGSKKLPGLFFAGEVLDIDGITGGYNFQNAWTTGYIAARAIGNALEQQVKGQ